MPCRNVGGIDRALRLGAGALLLPFGLFLVAGGHPHGWTVTIAGAFVLASGVLGFCPPYALFGFSTARPPRAPAQRGAHGSPASR